MTFENLPMFKYSVKILKAWSLILKYDWKRYACFVPSIIMNITQLLGLFTMKSSLDSYIQGVFFFILWFNGIIRSSGFVYHRYRYEKFMEDLNVAYKAIKEKEDKELIRILERTTELARRLEMANLCSATLATIAMCMYPLFTESRAHPYEAHFPGIKKFESPWYEIIYTFQVLASPAGVSNYIPFTSIVISFFMFGTMMCKVLHQHLQNLKRLKPVETWSEVIWCIRYQMKIIRYVDVLNSLTTYIFLIEFLAYGAMLCALTVVVIVAQSLTQVIVIFTYIAALFTHVAAIYWFANELSDHFTYSAVVAYDTNWFEYDIKTQKALKLFIARAQKPCSVLVGNIYPMSLETFQSLLNASYYCFTILKQFIE